MRIWSGSVGPSGAAKRPAGPGTVAIADMGHRAFILFGPLGAYAGSVPFGGDAGMVILGRLFPDGRGGILSVDKVDGGQVAVTPLAGPFRRVPAAFCPAFCTGPPAYDNDEAAHTSE